MGRMVDTTLCTHLSAFPHLSGSDCFFRLFTIDHVDENTHVTISLLEGAASHGVAYDAISYAWDDEKPSVRVTCNSGEIRITSSLHVALCQFYSLGFRQPLWADQICVSQIDDKDKARQVPMMGAYFTEASTVRIWLGPSTELSDLAFDYVPRFMQTITSLDVNTYPSASSLRSLGLPVDGDPFWHGLGDVICRRWFSRLWTLQEAGLAKQAYLYCGSKKLSLESWGSVTKALTDYAILYLVKGRPELDDRWTDYYTRALLIPLVQNLIRGGNRVPLPELMTIARAREASQPVDAVYAVLGLMDADVRKQITVDYSRKNREEYWNLYVELGHILLKRPPYLLLLTDASSLDRPLQLPSWCPNFSCVRSTRMLSKRHYAAGGAMDSRMESPLVSTSTDRRRIVLRGRQVEQIVSVVQSQWSWSRVRAMIVGPQGNAAKVLDFLDACRHLTQKTVGPTSDAMPEPFVRTLIGNFLYAPDEYGPPLSDLRRSLDTALRYWSRLKSDDTDHEPTDADRNVMGRFLNALLPMCEGRRYFDTSLMHVGMGPAEVQPGDRICVFRSLTVPLILRRRDNPDLAEAEEGGRELFELVGEAYVHGIMDGEIYKNPRETSPDRLFAIV